jgi:hypothetical protein
MTATRMSAPSGCGRRRGPASAASIASAASRRVVAHRRAPEHQADRQLAPAMARQAEGAAVEKVDDDGLRSRRLLAAKKPSSSATSGAIGGATIGTVGERRASYVLKRAYHARDPAAPRGDELDVVRGAHRRAASDPRRAARS